MRLGRHHLAEALKHLEAGDWQAAHDIVQKDEASPLACWAHGIVHIMEGRSAERAVLVRAGETNLSSEPGPAKRDPRPSAGTETLIRAPSPN